MTPDHPRHSNAILANPILIHTPGRYGGEQFGLHSAIQNPLHYAVRLAIGSVQTIDDSAPSLTILPDCGLSPLPHVRSILFDLENLRVSISSCNWLCLRLPLTAHLSTSFPAADRFEHHSHLISKSFPLLQQHPLLLK